MSPKPWAKLEIGYLSHPKFLALSANAICLWHEGKNYCDAHQTDGIIPKDALRTFRFRGVASVSLLLRSCGDKPNGSPYAPLWEAHATGGYRMHDYLDHNDCRDAVLARMEQADRNREFDREYKQRARAAKKTKRESRLEESHLVDVRTGQRPDGDRTVRLYAETESEPETRTTPSGVGPRPVPMAPIHDRSHRNHAHCGRVCLPAGLFGEFVRRRNHVEADREVRDWALVVEHEWGGDGPRSRDEPGDMFDFWKARYAEKWPVTAKAAAGTGTTGAAAHGKYDGFMEG